MLYLVPTPIGNLKDITLRAIDTLRNVNLILAEDTRVTSKLLNHYEIQTPTKAYHAHNEHKSTAKIIELLLKGEDIALVTDAGMPAISDPGFLLVRSCNEHSIQVVPLPGATALITAIAASGIPSDRFHFEGFLPAKKGRNKRLQFLETYPYSIILYESPYRVIKTLNDIKIMYENSRRVCVAKEISKIHEAFFTDFPDALINRLETGSQLKGEFVLIIEPEQK